MRCEDLTRELASPTGRLSRAEMAGHLADCPSCARWSRRAAHFDRIWEATRAPEPSEATLDALWANASAALDARAVPATLRLEGSTRRRRSWVKPALFVAQAAAILVAALVLLRQGSDKPVEVAVADPEPVIVEPVKAPEVTPLHVNVEPGETILVQIGNNANDYRTKILHEPAFDSSAIPEGTQFDFSRGVDAMLPNDWGTSVVLR